MPKYDFRHTNDIIFKKRTAQAWALYKNETIEPLYADAFTLDDFSEIKDAYNDYLVSLDY